MKKCCLVLSLCGIMGSTVAVAHNASSQDQLKNRAFWHPITIYNHAPYDIGYAVYAEGHMNSGFYIRTSSSDVYHSGFGDKRAMFAVSACVEYNPNGVCTHLVSRALPNYYNVEEIATIDIKSVYDVEVICVDGSTTSCMLK